MIKKEIINTFFIADLNELQNDEIKLINNAKSALASAYSSYSGFSVGASVLLEVVILLMEVIRRM